MYLLDRVPVPERVKSSTNQMIISNFRYFYSKVRYLLLYYKMKLSVCLYVPKYLEKYRTYSVKTNTKN